MSFQPVITRRSLLSGSAATAALALAGTRPSFAQDKKNIVVRVAKGAEVLDPHYRTGNVDGNVIRSIFQKLISFKPNYFEWELDAAESIEQTSPTEIRFKLKPGQMFTDGYGEMTAEDVKFTFERYGKPDAEGNISAYKDDWTSLVEVKVDDQYSGRLILSGPSPALWNVALAGGSGAIVSRKAVEELGIKHRQKPIGSGPYKVEIFEPGQRVVLTENADYSRTKPDFMQCTVQLIANPKTAELALRSGEIDFTELAVGFDPALADQPKVKVLSMPALRYVWLGMNVENATLKDRKVREAIRYGLDVGQMIEAGYEGQAKRLNAMLPKGVDGFWPDAPVYERDVEKAKTLLAEAGISNPSLKVTILNEPAFQNMALVAQAQLAEIGIDLQIDQRESASYWSAGKGDAGKTLELFILRFNAHIDPNFNTRFFQTEQIGEWNWQRWSSPEYDALHKASSANMNHDDRMAQIREMQKIMDQSAAFVWLTNEVVNFGHSAAVAPALMPNGNDWNFHYFKRA